MATPSLHGSSLQEGLAWLDSHISVEAGGTAEKPKAPVAGDVDDLSLESMRQLVAALGDPQLDVPVIQVTGTNGKGSTAAIITSLLVATGLTVGTYASPHVSVINERIQLNGEPIEDDAFGAVLADLRLAVDVMGLTPSWFELVTAAAFRYFADAAVDVAVIEVGMLGRFDATNIVDAQVGVVTNVGFDHTDGNGDWRSQVAWEKAGIVKADSTLVLGETEPDVAAIFRAEPAARIVERGPDFDCVGNQLAVGGRLVDLQTARSEFRDVFLSLHGAHQGDNASAAVAAVEEFLDTALTEEVVEEALGTVTVPGRFEIIGREPLIVIDGAHNPDGARIAADTMAEDFAAVARRYLVVGMMRERDPAEMLAALGADQAELVLATSVDWPRAMPAAELAAAASSMGLPVETTTSVADAVDRARALAEPEDAIFVVGSLYVAGDARNAVTDD